MRNRHDPDWLALLLCELVDVDVGERRAALPATNSNRPSTGDKLLKRYAPVLDSLARLLVYRSAKQVVAVAFQPARAEVPPTFVLAQNEDVPQEVEDHLVTLLARLRRCRDVCIANYGHSSQAPKVSTKMDPVQYAYLEGEFLAIRYCWKKSKRRFTKDRRYEAFLALVADVQGEYADQRAECGDEERTTLKALQDCTTVDRTRLEAVHSSISSMRDIILNHEFSASEEPTSGGRRMLMRLRNHCHHLIQHTSDANHLWSLCEEYLSDLKNMTTVDSLSSVHPTQTVTKPFDVAKWLSKLVLVSRDYVQILHATMSSTIADVLFVERPFRVVRVPSTQVSTLEPIISTAEIKATLREAGWLDVENEVFSAVIENLCHTLSSANDAVAPGTDSAAPDASFSGKLRPHVHCECAVLAHLHQSGDIDSAIPYVGVSKPSCALCAAYFQSYREVTDSVVSTRETNGQLVPWLTPSLARDWDAHSAVDADVRERVCGQLMEKLECQAKEVRRHCLGRLSTSEESTGGAFRPGLSQFLNVSTKCVDDAADEMLRRLTDMRTVWLKAEAEANAKVEANEKAVATD